MFHTQANSFRVLNKQSDADAKFTHVQSFNAQRYLVNKAKVVARVSMVTVFERALRRRVAGRLELSCE